MLAKEHPDLIAIKHNLGMISSDYFWNNLKRVKGELYLAMGKDDKATEFLSDTLEAIKTSEKQNSWDFFKENDLKSMWACGVTLSSSDLLFVGENENEKANEVEILRKVWWPFCLNLFVNLHPLLHTHKKNLNVKGSLVLLVNDVVSEQS